MDEQLQHVAQLPDGAMGTFVLEVIAYITPEGQSAYVWRLQGDAAYAEVLGAWDMVRDDLHTKRRAAAAGGQPL